RFADLGIFLIPRDDMPYDRKAEVYLFSNGDIEKARGVYQEALENIRPDILINQRSYIEILARDYQKALDIEKARTGGFLRKADIYRYLGQPEQAATYYDSARVEQEELVRIDRDDYVAHSNLGIAYAGLGRREEAIREGKLAVEILPLSRDAYYGPHFILDLARIYAMLGEQDAAVDQLELLLSIPSEITVPLLRLDPVWDPLREHPRFQALMAG
ncbi:MAG: tetratricopeptide repeat protein, partial [Planctomycetes bacterium]|nr:tetratricopeptide repeat protein [Planctomycetota bacterium]